MKVRDELFSSVIEKYYFASDLNFYYYCFDEGCITNSRLAVVCPLI